MKDSWTPAFAGVTIGIALSVVFSPVYLFADTLAANQARVSQITGSVQVLPLGSSQWADASPGLPIEPGDQIQVGDDGEAELRITQNALWVLQNNTDVLVHRLTTQEGRVTLSRGALLGKVGTMSDGLRDVWEFETPVGIATVRGTEWALMHSEEDGTRLGVFKGSVELTPAESATETFPAVMINANEEGALRKKAPLKKSAVFSPAMMRQKTPVKALQARFRALVDIWSPFTPEYRKELRQKLIPPTVLKKTAPPKPKRGPHAIN